MDTIDQVIPLGTNLDSVIAKLQVLQYVADEAMNRRGQFNDNVAPFMEQFQKSEPLWRVLIANKKYASGYDIAPAEYGDMFMALLNIQENTEGASAPQSRHDATNRNEYEL